MSRNGNAMNYWGGASPGNGKQICACRMNNSCIRAGLVCNCHKNENVWREDSGLLTDKIHLPVKQMRLGDTGSYEKMGYHTLGKFKNMELPDVITHVRNAISYTLLFCLN